MAASSTGRLLKTGLIGSTIAAVCCVTPVLTVTLGFIGLGAMTGYLDYVLLPALALFIGITIYAVVQKFRRPCVEGKGRFPHEKRRL